MRTGRIVLLQLARMSEKTLAVIGKRGNLGLSQNTRKRVRKPVVFDETVAEFSAATRASV